MVVPIALKCSIYICVQLKNIPFCPVSLKDYLNKKDYLFVANIIIIFYDPYMSGKIRCLTGHWAVPTQPLGCFDS